MLATAMPVRSMTEKCVVSSGSAAGGEARRSLPISALVYQKRRRWSGIDRRMSACCAKAVVAAPLRPGVGRRLPVR